MQSATISFKYADVCVDLFRALREPTQKNLQKVAINTVYLYNMQHCGNASIGLIALDIFSNVYTGEYLGALYSVMAATAYYSVPYTLAYLGVPALSFAYGAGMLCYSAYSFAQNV